MAAGMEKGWGETGKRGVERMEDEEVENYMEYIDLCLMAITHQQIVHRCLSFPCIRV